MRLPTDPRLAPSTDVNLIRLLRDIAKQVNGITEGQQYAFHASMTAAPTTGSWAKGDFVLNSAPAEAGAAGSKYIIHGWRCTVAGTPGTWLEVRTLTGN